MPKNSKSIEATRKALVKALSTGSCKVVDKVIHFSNDEVPNYLRHLKDLKSQPSKILPTTRRINFRSPEETP